MARRRPLWVSWLRTVSVVWIRMIKESVATMRSIRIMGLCLVVAAVALSAFTATSALAAAPEYGRCIKKVKAEGKGYTSNKCTTSGEGTKAKYEWIPGAGKHKFTTSGGTGKLETVNGKIVTCEHESSTGEFNPTNFKQETTAVRFAGCKSEGFPCTTEGLKEGELETRELLGEVGFETGKKTALELRPGPNAGGLFISFKCIGITIEVRPHGGILVPIKNDAMKTTEALKYKATKGKQKPVKWANSSEEQYLESNFAETGYERAGQTITAEVTGEEALELNTAI